VCDGICEEDSPDIGVASYERAGDVREGGAMGDDGMVEDNEREDDNGGGQKATK
jgi:hypothetical protein